MTQFKLLSLNEMVKNAEDLVYNVRKEHNALENISKLPAARQAQVNDLNRAIEDVSKGKQLTFTKKNNKNKLTAINSVSRPLYFTDEESAQYIAGAILFYDDKIRQEEYKNSMTSKLLGKSISNFINPPEGNRFFKGSTFAKGAYKAVGATEENPLDEKTRNDLINFYRRAYLKMITHTDGKPDLNSCLKKIETKERAFQPTVMTKTDNSIYSELTPEMRKLYDLFFDRKKGHAERVYDLKPENKDRINTDIQLKLFSNDFAKVKADIQALDMVDPTLDEYANAFKFKL